MLLCSMGEMGVDDGDSPLQRHPSYLFNTIFIYVNDYTDVKLWRKTTKSQKIWNEN